MALPVANGNPCRFHVLESMLVLLYSRRSWPMKAVEPDAEVKQLAVWLMAIAVAQP
jgi:hypothetical protein